MELISICSTACDVNMMPTFPHHRNKWVINIAEIEYSLRFFVNHNVFVICD